jgi:glutamate-1-semialdehyde 2,1-aminomutase
VAAGVPGRVNLSGSLLTMFFGDADISNYADAKNSRTQLYPKFFHGMLDRGIFLAPSQFEALFISAAHTDADIDQTIIAAQESLQLLL